VVRDEGHHGPTPARVCPRAEAEETPPVSVSLCSQTLHTYRLVVERAHTEHSMHKAFSQINVASRVVSTAICQPNLGSCCSFGFLPPHHGGKNDYKVLQDPNGVQVRQPDESCAKKNYVFRSHELAAMTHKYTGHSFSSFF